MYKNKKKTPKKNTQKKKIPLPLQKINPPKNL